MKKRSVMAIDQGTTSSRAMIFSMHNESVAMAQQEFTQYYPHDGWVEHDPEEIWSSVVNVCREVLDTAEKQNFVVEGIGITNQRETVIVWDRQTGEPLYRAIVWQDRRTAAFCDMLKAAGHEQEVTERSGLLLDPYFSATKLRWILENVQGARARAEAGELAFGTVDTFLLWRLTDGAVHATDVTNASRTMLFNIHTQEWDDTLLKLFDIPARLLPEVRDCVSDFGMSAEHLFGQELPIAGIAGDQQSAAIAQGCLSKGMSKSTYGTGCFLLLNTGREPFTSKNRLLSTIAYRIKGETAYALEGSIFIAGAAVQWLRDGIKVIESAREVEQHCRAIDSNRGVYMVPAFTGLGAPHWDPRARGAIFGLTRDSGVAEIVRATVESVAYQTYDLIEAMQRDTGSTFSTLRVDGGMSANDWFLQFLADILDIKVERPKVTETTALGAALLAGVGVGLHDSLHAVGRQWQCDARFSPGIDASKRETLLAGWHMAVKKVLET